MAHWRWNTCTYHFLNEVWEEKEARPILLWWTLSKAASGTIFIYLWYDAVGDWTHDLPLTERMLYHWAIAALSHLVIKGQFRVQSKVVGASLSCAHVSSYFVKTLSLNKIFFFGTPTYTQLHMLQTNILYLCAWRLSSNIVSHYFPWSSSSIISGE